MLVLLVALVRPDEIPKLGRDDWDPAKGTLRVPGARARTLVLEPRHAGMLQEWMRRRGTEPGPLVPPLYRGQRSGARRSLTATTIRDLTRARAQAVGLRRITPRDLHRAALALALADGLSPEEVAAKAGLHDANGLRALARRVALDRSKESG